MEEKLTEIISKVKEKREISGIPDEVVEELLIKKSKSENLNLKDLKKSELKRLIKLSRAELRRYSGNFTSSFDIRKKLLDKGDIKALLETSSSTRERISIYPFIIDIITNLSIKTILDLGCGINPIALAEKLPQIKYYSYDIDFNNIEAVRIYFGKKGVNGEARILDLRKDNVLPKSDMCIMFKFLDIIEKKGHKKAEEIIKSINSKYLLISFSTKTLSGRPMNHPQRGQAAAMVDPKTYTKWRSEAAEHRKLPVIIGVEAGIAAQCLLRAGSIIGAGTLVPDRENIDGLVMFDGGLTMYRHARSTEYRPLKIR